MAGVAWSRETVAGVEGSRARLPRMYIASYLSQNSAAQDDEAGCGRHSLFLDQLLSLTFLIRGQREFDVA